MPWMALLLAALLALAGCDGDDGKRPEHQGRNHVFHTVSSRFWSNSGRARATNSL